MHRLAFTRIVVCAALIVISLNENAAALSWIPASMRVDMGVINLIPETFSRDPLIWTLVDVFVPLALLVALIGYRTRLSLIIGASAYFIETGLIRAHNYLYHPGLVPLQMALLLILTPCGDALSLDARWGRVRRKPDAVYQWALVLVLTPLVMSYLMAGLNKLRNSGLVWFTPDNLRGYVASNQNRIPQPSLDLTTWINRVPDLFWTGMALMTVGIELGYISVLWSRRARWVFPIGAVAMHLGIWALLGSPVLRSDSFATGGLPNGAGMVLRYKALVVGALAIFALVWWNGVEFFPLSLIPMYSKPSLDIPALYFRVRAADGSIIDDNAAFFIATYRSGDEVVAGRCFSGETEVCRDYFSLVAHWIGQPITLELWEWNYKTDERTRIATVSIDL